MMPPGGFRRTDRRLIHLSAWRSTLAIWPRNTPHWLGLLRRSLRLFAGRCGRPTREKSPCKRICSCWKVRAEIEGAKSLQALFHMVGRGIHPDHRFLGIGVKGISIPFAHKWLSRAVKKLSEKGYEQRSERGFGRYIGGPKRAEQCRFGALGGHV